MNKKYLVFSFSIMLLFTIIISCSLKPKGTLLLVLDVEPLEGFDKNIFKEVIETRILINCKTSEINKFTFENNTATIVVGGVPDDQKSLESLLSALTQTGGGLQFFETYDANQQMETILEYSKGLNIQLYDSLKNSLKNYKQNTLEEKLKYKNDSVEIENGLNQPFNGLINLNIRKGEGNDLIMPNGSLLGYCKRSDSTKLFALLDTAVARHIFQKDLVFRTKVNDYDKNSLEIHTLKLSIPSYKAAMEGDLIESAIVEYEKEIGSILILLKFKTGYHEIWRQLTKKCAPKNEMDAGKSIAIVYDNILLSAPIVKSEIAKGNATITGGFSYEEANSLASKLNSGNIPCKIKVGHFEYKKLK